MIEQHYTRLPLERAYNIRDLGGYPCSYGSVTQWKTFLRGDNLAFLTGTDIRFLKQYGLKTVIDLRSQDELNHLPGPFARDTDIAYHNIPFMAGNIADVTRSLAEKPAEFLTTFYNMLLEEGKENLKEIMTLISKHEKGTLLYHCTAGKDRTGIISMLLLSIAGVSEEDIVSNYCTTYHHNLANPRIRDMRDTVPREILSSSHEYIMSAMSYLDERYGSPQQYLRSVGIGTSTIESIRALLCAS